MGEERWGSGRTGYNKTKVNGLYEDGEAKEWEYYVL